MDLTGEYRIPAPRTKVWEALNDPRYHGKVLIGDPRVLDTVRLWFVALRRKYGDSLADVIAFRDETEQRLAELEGYEQRVARLERERRDADRAYNEALSALDAAIAGGADRDVFRDRLILFLQKITAFVETKDRALGGSELSAEIVRTRARTGGAQLPDAAQS